MSEYVMTIKFQEEKEPYLLDISSMLYDLELAHDFSVILANSETYKKYQFDRYFWYRKGRPLLKEHRIRVLKIVKQSPLLLEVVIPSLGAIWILVQILDKVSNWRLNRKKLKLEVDKLQREEQESKRKTIDIYLEQRNETDEINLYVKKLIERLSETKIIPTEIEVKEHKDENG